MIENEKYDSIYNKIRYFISVKSDIIYVISHNYAKSRFVQFFTSRKTITFHNVIILNSSVWNKDKNNYYFNIFLEKASYELPKKIGFCIKYKCYIMIELTLLKELMLIQQRHQKSAIFVTISIF